MRVVFGSIAAGLTVAVVGVGVLLAPSPPSAVPVAATQASQQVPTARTVAHARTAPASYTLVLGDSIALRGKDELKELRPYWVVDAVGGRSVNELLPLIRDWRERRGRAPAQLVVALGTNWSRGWEPTDYRQVRALLPKTQVEFVTPYRSAQARHPRSTGAYAEGRTGDYAAAMRYLAREGEEVCIAEWRALVKARPALLEDGVHPTAAGEQAWAELVSGSMRDCRLATG